MLVIHCELRIPWLRFGDATDALFSVLLLPPLLCTLDWMQLLHAWLEHLGLLNLWLLLVSNVQRFKGVMPNRFNASGQDCGIKFLVSGSALCLSVLMYKRTVPASSKTS